MQIEKQIAEIQNVVDDVLKMALKKGATQAEASMSKVQGIAVSSRMCDVENVEFNNDGGLGISVYVGKHKGSASTADLSKEALALTVEKAVDIARYTSEDPCTGLADKELIATEFPDLELYHPIEPLKLSGPPWHTTNASPTRMEHLITQTWGCGCMVTPMVSTPAIRAVVTA